MRRAWEKRKRRFASAPFVRFSGASVRWASLRYASLGFISQRSHWLSFVVTMEAGRELLDARVGPVEKERRTGIDGKLISGT